MFFHTASVAETALSQDSHHLLIESIQVKVTTMRDEYDFSKARKKIHTPLS
jgi:hypothetical protein